MNAPASNRIIDGSPYNTAKYFVFCVFKKFKLLLTLYTLNVLKINPHVINWILQQSLIYIFGLFVDQIPEKCYTISMREHTVMIE